MKIFNCFRFLLPVLAAALFHTCAKDEPSPWEKHQKAKVQVNGLTEEINKIVPQAVLDSMKRLGMPIYGGGNPPKIESAFLVTPFILLNSNVPSDFPGMSFADDKITLYEQDNENLTIKVDYENGPESGYGIGSFIVGEGCKFSVFVQINAEHTNGSKAKVIHVFSGSFVDGGIKDFYFSNFMLDNYEDPTGIWIEPGEGRVAYDSDGFSDFVNATALKWYEKLPPCPCTYAEAQALEENDCFGGKWEDCGTANQDFHYGAKWEVRWSPSRDGQAGQQCTYDASGNLITAGIAAGSPDKVSPRSCGTWDWLDGLGVALLCWSSEHCQQDVEPWINKPCSYYLQNWPSNNKNACGQANPGTDIQHMLSVIGQMTCAEVTLLFKTIDSSPYATSELKNFFHKRLNYTPVGLKQQLQDVYDKNGCSSNPGSDECSVLKKAIDNL